jgi:hypothetical protein
MRRTFPVRHQLAESAHGGVTAGVITGSVLFAERHRAGAPGGGLRGEALVLFGPTDRKPSTRRNDHPLRSPGIVFSMLFQRIFRGCRRVGAAWPPSRPARSLIPWRGSSLEDQRGEPAVSSRLQQGQRSPAVREAGASTTRSGCPTRWPPWNRRATACSSWTRRPWVCPGREPCIYDREFSPELVAVETSTPPSPTTCDSRTTWRTSASRFPDGHPSFGPSGETVKMGGRFAEWWSVSTRIPCWGGRGASRRDSPQGGSRAGAQNP